MSFAETNLFKPIKVGHLTLKNRLVHAPTTRTRNSEEFVATDAQLDYYTQRAENNGGLLITEATFAAPEFGLYEHGPMIKTPAQVAAWKKIVDSVHSKGSAISLQIWNLGVAADPAALKKRNLPYVGASEWFFDENYRAGSEAVRNPLHMLTVDEIHAQVKEYAAAAKRAIDEAGFDFVEVHCANMYLLEQFIQAVSNHRTDEYGGSIENRARFALEAIDAVIEAVGADHVGVRLSPYSSFQGGEGLKAKINPVVSHGYILSELERRAKEGKRLAYVSFVEPRIAAGDDTEEEQEIDTSWVNEIWKGVIIRTGALLSDPQFTQMKKYLEDERTLIGSGRYFTSNPDLPERLRKGLPLTKYDRSRFYTPGKSGYSTWGKYGEKEVETDELPKALA